MKMDPNITDNITVESNYLVCAATELFVKFLAKNVYEMDSRCLDYQNLSKFVQEDEKLDFLVRHLSANGFMRLMFAYFSMTSYPTKSP